MKSINLNYWGRTKYWWVVLLVGILMVLCGFAYWLWPVQGYAVASVVFGWLLVLAGIVQLCVSAGKERPKGWGWWLFGGIIDMFIGFMLVRNVVLSETVLPYFFAIVFLFWGISAIFGSASNRRRKYWWVELINGILLMTIGFLFIESGWMQDMWMVSFITSIAFIYWGFSLTMLSCDMRPAKKE